MNEYVAPTLRPRPAWAATPMAVLILLMPALPSASCAAESALPPPATLPLHGAEIRAGRGS